MIKYFCDRCGKNEKLENGYTIPFMNKNENGIMHHGGFFICNECYHRWREVKDRVSDIDFVELSDEELQPYRCDFKIGDEVIDKYGRTGKIIEICTCERCRERGFFEPTVQLDNGSTDYIMRYDWDTGFKSYYQIGNHIFGNLDEESVSKEIDECNKRMLQLYEQLGTIQELRIINQHRKKENNNEI